MLVMFLRPAIFTWGVFAMFIFCNSCAQMWFLNPSCFHFLEPVHQYWTCVPMLHVYTFGSTNFQIICIWEHWETHDLLMGWFMVCFGLCFNGWRTWICALVFLGMQCVNVEVNFGQSRRDCCSFHSCIFQNAQPNNVWDCLFSLLE